MSEEPTLDENTLLWLDDLERCDGYNPCGECDRCTEGGTPWLVAREKWLNEWEDYLEGQKIAALWGG